MAEATAFDLDGAIEEGLLTADELEVLHEAFMAIAAEDGTLDPTELIASLT